MSPKNNRGWLAVWLQGRRRGRAGLHDAEPVLANAPAVSDLVTWFRSAEGFQLQFTSGGNPAVSYRGYWRLHGSGEWTLLGVVEPDFALELEAATEHSFDIKVTATGDGVSYSTAEVDSNIVQTVNDSELDDAPAITDLSVIYSGDETITLNWSDDRDETQFLSFYREMSGDWMEGPVGYLRDGSVSFSGLTNGTEYEFKVQTYGTGSQLLYKIAAWTDSNIVSGTPNVPGLPPAPTIGFAGGNVSVTSSVAGIATVNFYFIGTLDDSFEFHHAVEAGGTAFAPCEYQMSEVGYWKASVVGDDITYSGESELSDYIEITCGP